MVDVLKTLNLEYLGSNPGSTFESLHESLINYGNNKMPEFLTCCHEESAVAMAHGYYKIEGKPMMALLHGDIGLQHASMAIYIVGDLDQAMGPTTPKLVIVAAPATLELLLPEARRRWKGRLNVATSTPDYLEFTSIESDKATALSFMAERLGVPRPATVAVGDGRNDASMIEWAGLGVAIQGSPEEVQRVADRTIPGPGRGGIKQLADLLVES